MDAFEKLGIDRETSKRLAKELNIHSVESLTTILNYKRAKERHKLGHSQKKPP